MADRGKTLSTKILQETDDDVISIGEVYKGVCDAGMPPSTTTIVSNNLAGYGDDYFNTDWVLLILFNNNNHGVAPEGQVRDITDYVSDTGTFTTVAFGANIEPDDIIMVAYTKHYQFAASAEYYDTSGPNTVQIDDIGNYNMAIYDVGNVVPTVAEITAGNYQIDRLRAGVLTNIVPSSPASKATGRIHAAVGFTAASGWAIGDLAYITFSGGSIGVTGVTTVLPNQYFWTRIDSKSVTSATPSSGSIDDFDTDVDQNLIPTVTVTTVIQIDSIIVDFTNWLADASIVGSGATLTITVWMEDDGGVLRKIGNLQDIITEGVSIGSMVQINGIGTFERDFSVSVQSSVAPTGGVGSDLVKYHYASYDRE